MTSREDFDALVARLSKEELAVRLEYAVTALTFFANNGDNWDRRANLPVSVEQLAKAAIRDVMKP